MEQNIIDRSFIRKGKLKQQGNDFAFWQTKPFMQRLITIEQIRQEYNIWKYGTEQGFQRVYQIIKRQRG